MSHDEMLEKRNAQGVPIEFAPAQAPALEATPDIYRRIGPTWCFTHSGPLPCDECDASRERAAMFCVVCGKPYASLGSPMSRCGKALRDGVCTEFVEASICKVKR